MPLFHKAPSNMAASTAGVSSNCKLVPAAKLKVLPGWPNNALDNASTWAGVTKPAMGLKLVTPAAAKFPTEVAVAVKLVVAKSVLVSEI